MCTGSPLTELGRCCCLVQSCSSRECTTWDSLFWLGGDTMDTLLKTFQTLINPQLLTLAILLRMILSLMIVDLTLMWIPVYWKKRSKLFQRFDQLLPRWNRKNSSSGMVFQIFGNRKTCGSVISVEVIAFHIMTPNIFIGFRKIRFLGFFIHYFFRTHHSFVRVQEGSYGPS